MDRPVKWENSELYILDQTKLPDATDYVKLGEVEDV